MTRQSVFKPHLTILKKCPLFFQVKDEELLPMLACLGAKITKYAKNDTIVESGRPVTKVGILLSGKIKACRVDYYGNRSIINQFEEGEIFGASFACTQTTNCPLDIIASTDSTIMFVDCERVVTTCGNSCSFHNQIIKNLLTIVARKNLQFSQKIEIISKRNTRDKLLTYLMLEATKAGKREFDIPFDRQELADYLEVERSGLSAEISRLRKEGCINSNRSHFELLKLQ